MMLKATEEMVFDAIGTRFEGELWVPWMVRFVIGATAEVEDDSREGGLGSDT